jgi:hypothetical protein
MMDKQDAIFDAITKLKNDLIDLREDHLMRAKELNDALAALKRLEWYGFRASGLRQCPVCFALQREGKHAPHCWLGQILHPASSDGTLTIKKGK